MVRRVVTLVLAGLVLAGCSGGQQAAPPPSSSSVPPSVTTSAAAPDPGADVIRKVIAAVTRDETYHLVIVPGVGDVLLSVEGDVRLVPGAQGHGDLRSEDMDVTMMVKTKAENPDEPLHLIQLAGKTYIKLLPAQNPAPDKPWAELDENGQDEFTDWTLSRRDETAQFGTPTDYSLPLLAAGGRLDGQAQEAGGTRYRYTLDLKRTVANLTDPFLKDEAQRGIDGQGKTLTYELLVGPQDQLAELVMRTVVTQTGQEVVSTGKFSGWGKPLTLVAPPAAEVTQR